jgi:F-type H+-transporting ATPase subunit b
MDIDLTLLFQLGLFLLALVVLNRLLFKPLLEVIEQRREKMVGLKEQIERLRHDAAADLAVYQSRLREARDLAQREREALVSAGREEERRLLADVRAEIAKALNEARVEIERAELEAHASLSRDTEEMARHLVSKVLGREVRP